MGVDETARLSLLAATRALFLRLSPRRRRQLWPVLGLMLIGAAAEVFALGALLPFLAVVADPQGSPMMTWVRPALSELGAHTAQQMMYALAAIFAVTAFVAAVVRIALLWISQRFIYSISYDLGIKLYANVLCQPYIYHTRQNSSEIIASINKVQIITNDFLVPLMNAAVAVVIAIFIIGGLIIIDPFAASITGIVFSGIYLGTSVFARDRLRSNSAVISRAQGSRVQTMQEGLGGIRDLLLDRSQPVFIEAYQCAEANLRDARVRNGLFAAAPRFVVEGVGMVLIALIAVSIVGRPGGVAAAIPVLGALALGAQRLLPLIQQIYAGWASAMGTRQSVMDIVHALHRAPAPAEAASTPLPFSTSISFDDVGYNYVQGRPPVLSAVTFEIRKGARVGVVGKTGSGKSTLMDLVIGLLEPTHGEIRIDGVALTASNRAAWQRNIAHVPQSIYLVDASVAENIAFGVRPTEIDHARVRDAAEQAELTEVIAALPEGYNTRVGERGVQLSGGQRQRVGIARALYKQASVLVFDEATSALDSKTESAVMTAINRLSHELTILIIAHRLSTLDGCDMIIRLEEHPNGSRLIIAP